MMKHMKHHELLSLITMRPLGRSRATKVVDKVDGEAFCTFWGITKLRAQDADREKQVLKS